MQAHRTWIVYFLIWFCIWFDIKCHRKYSHSREELKLTRNVVIDQVKCHRGQIPIAIHSAAQTSGKYYQRRQVTRNTWAKVAKDHGMKPIFFIGLPNSYKTQRELESEANRYNDIVQFGFEDNYYNLTLKALGVIRWMAKNCLTSNYILKTDDDVFVNIPLLEENIRKKRFADGLTGHLTAERSNRRFGSKWFMPRDVYRYSYYRFLLGFSYLMSKNSLKKLYTVSKNLSGPVLDIDDLFVTGVLAGKTRVLLYDDKRFDMDYCGKGYCHMRQLIASHGCQTPKQTLKMWINWIDSDNWKCPNYTRNSIGSRRFKFGIGNFKINLDVDNFFQ